MTGDTKAKVREVCRIPVWFSGYNEEPRSKLRGMDPSQRITETGVLQTPFVWLVVILGNGSGTPAAAFRGSAAEG
jgi:hypothetical protein